VFCCSGCPLSFFGSAPCSATASPLLCSCPVTRRLCFLGHVWYLSSRFLSASVPADGPVVAFCQRERLRELCFLRRFSLEHFPTGPVPLEHLTAGAGLPAPLCYRGSKREGCAPCSSPSPGNGMMPKLEGQSQEVAATLGSMSSHSHANNCLAVQSLHR
jgi:hypothetical protein